MLRFLVVVALMVWQGGFTFYAGVVVPVAMSTLRPPALQSFVTLRVTRYLNLAGAVALGVFALEMLSTRGGRRGARWLCWGLMAATLVGLFLLHPQVARYMDAETQTVLDRDALYPLHRVYLWVSAAQWLLAMVFLGLTLQAWRVEDREGWTGA